MTQVAPEYANRVHVRPMNDQVAILPIREKRHDVPTVNGIVMDLRVSPGGIAIPDEVDNTEVEGVIVALGDGVRYELPWWLARRLAQTALGDATNEAVDELARTFCDEAAKPHPFQTKLGDRVLWVPWLAQTVITPEGTEWNLVAERDIAGIFQA